MEALQDYNTGSHNTYPVGSPALGSILCSSGYHMNRKVVVSMERVQRRLTKISPELEVFSYAKRLEKLGWYSQKQRMKG